MGTVSSQTEVTTLTGDDVFYLVDGGTASRRITAENARPYFGAVASNTQTGTSYTLVLGDAGKAVTMDNAAASTLTVPPNSSVAFPIGTIVGVEQLGAGTVTLTEGSGVEIRSRLNLVDLAGQYAVASLRKIGTDEWLATGDLS